MIDFTAKWDQGLDYKAFLAKHGSDEHRSRWEAFHAQVKLTEAQRSLLASFKRDMKVFCLAGAWCGDCVNQCPMFDHFAAASPRIALRFFDRDIHPDLAAELKLCGGARVPVLVFVSEDGNEVGRYGDRTLTRYRELVAKLDGASCPTGLVLPDQSTTAAVLQDWLDEFERAQWILRTSARLRQVHGD
jgi:thiol-disulfide isomerase/thioredoxin